MTTPGYCRKSSLDPTRGPVQTQTVLESSYAFKAEMARRAELSRMFLVRRDAKTKPRAKEEIE
jgi:hypothetical protein